MTTIGVMRRDDARAMPFHQALTEKNCLGCHSDHEGMKAYRAPVSFSHQLLAPEVRTQCASCHKKPEDVLHQKITGACIQCHNQTKWRATTFDHSKFFELDSRHKVACATCHTSRDFKSYSCFGCHEHQRDKIAAFHRKRGIRNVENCTNCHKNAHEKEDD